jgi:hypothetical protein
LTERKLTLSLGGELRRSSRTERGGQSPPLVELNPAEFLV